MISDAVVLECIVEDVLAEISRRFNDTICSKYHWYRLKMENRAYIAHHVDRGLRRKNQLDFHGRSQRIRSQRCECKIVKRARLTAFEDVNAHLCQTSIITT